MAEKKTNELVIIQAGLKAPKNQRNNFGKYNYRSCEDILEAVKPLLKETSCTLTISDEIVPVGERVYVKATAVLCTSNGETYTTSAFAREPFEKKGMDDSQVTGATSSYARKYALNGLFCIDDNKDADALNTSKEFTEKPQPASQPAPQPVDDPQLKEAFEILKPEIDNAPSRDYLNMLHANNPALHNYGPYRTLMNSRFKQVK